MLGCLDGYTADSDAVRGGGDGDDMNALQWSGKNKL